MLSLTKAALAVLALAVSQLATAAPTAGRRVPRSQLEPRREKIVPKVMIVSMFSYERSEWVEGLDLVHNTTVRGLSPLYPKVACNEAADVCIFTTGEGEINAAASTMALLLSDRFDFKETYWVIAGIAGVNPYRGTLGTVAISDFAIQVALQQEIDAREIPSNWTTGYFAQVSRIAMRIDTTARLTPWTWRRTRTHPASCPRQTPFVPPLSSVRRHTHKLTSPFS